MKIRSVVVLILVALFLSGCVFGRVVRRVTGPTLVQTTGIPVTEAVQTAGEPDDQPTVPMQQTTPKMTPMPPLKMIPEIQRDVQYYDQPPGQKAQSTRLDIYTANGSGNPVMIYVHGGGWKAGDKNNVHRKPEVFNTAGYVFISVNYRMLPEAEVVTQAQDIARAVAWVYTHATEFGGDPKRLFLMGHSAGCHLVSLVATDASYLEAEGLTLQVIKGVVALDTQAYDVTALMQERSRLGLYSDAFGEDPEYWSRVSPIAYVAHGSGIPPFIVAYSRQGGARRAQAAEQFVQALQDAGVTAQLLPAIEKTHAEINQQFGEPGDRVTQAVLEFLAQFL